MSRPTLSVFCPDSSYLELNKGIKPHHTIDRPDLFDPTSKLHKQLCGDYIAHSGQRSLGFAGWTAYHKYRSSSSSYFVPHAEASPSTSSLHGLDTPSFPPSESKAADDTDMPRTVFQRNLALLSLAADELHSRVDDDGAKGLLRSTQDTFHSAYHDYTREEESTTADQRERTELHLADAADKLGKLVDEWAPFKCDDDDQQSDTGADSHSHCSSFSPESAGASYDLGSHSDDDLMPAPLHIHKASSTNGRFTID